MGHNVIILAEDSIPTTLHSRSLCLELRETIHDHFSDIRPVWTKEEFLTLSDHWAAARKKYDELGQPEPAETSCTLDARMMSGDCLHRDRVALEVTKGGSPKGDDMVHFHYDNLRIHMTQSNFLQVAQIFKEALECYMNEFSKVINLNDLDVYWGTVVDKEYLSALEEYEGGANPDDFKDLYLKSRRLIRPEDEQRYSDGWLKREDGSEFRNQGVPEEFDRKYLYAVLESIKKHGYGEGPYKNDYVRAQRTDEGKLLLTGSHRIACLLHLGYNEIRVVEVFGHENHVDASLIQHS